MAQPFRTFEDPDEPDLCFRNDAGQAPRNPHEEEATKRDFPLCLRASSSGSGWVCTLPAGHGKERDHVAARGNRILERWKNVEK